MTHLKRRNRLTSHTYIDKKWFHTDIKLTTRGVFAVEGAISLNINIFLNTKLSVIKQDKLFH